MWKKLYKPAVLAFVVVLAGCGGRSVGDNEDSGRDGVTPQTSAIQATTTSSTTTIARSTTTSVDVTTTVAPATTTTTSPPVTTTSTTFQPAGGDFELPDSFGALDEFLALVVDRAYFMSALDAQAFSYIAVEGDPDYLAEHEIEPGIAASVTVTYLGDLTVWDHDGGYREVDRGSEALYLGQDGEWHENDAWEWPLMGPYYEWSFVQPIAAGCIEHGAEMIGVEDVAGVPTLHIRCSLGSEEETAQSDIWIGEMGHVMKAYSEAGETPELTIITFWEVTGLNVHPGDPLPPGW